MAQLRHYTPRPELIVDTRTRAIQDPSTQSQVGIPAWLGRARVLYALPNNCGPNLMQPPTLVRDQRVNQIADPANAVIGKDWVWIPRLLAARWVEDTRRICG